MGEETNLPTTVLIFNAMNEQGKTKTPASYVKYDDSEYFYCTNCGHPTADDSNVSWHNYCPVCGVKVNGGKE